MDWSQANIANGIAALINGYRQGAKEARDSAMQDQELDLKRAAEARAMQELAMRQEKSLADIDYMNALGQRAMRENNMSPEGSQFLAESIGMPYNTGQSFSIPEANTLTNAFDKRQSLAAQMRMMRMQKELYKKSEKNEENTRKYFIQRDKYLRDQKVKLQGQYQSMMNDPEKAMGALTMIEEVEKQINENAQNAQSRGIDLFINIGAPEPMPAPTYVTPTAQPIQNNQPGYFERAMGFMKNPFGGD